MSWVKNTLGRRGFLKALGMAPAAALAGSTDVGIAAGLFNRAGAGNAALGVALGNNERPPMIGFSPIPTATTPGRVEMARVAFKQLLDAGIVSLPEHLVDCIRADAHGVPELDPDLAANVSFSISTKIRMQRDRNFQRSIERMRKHGIYDKARKDFEAKYGFELW